jgi:hypothetical protein
MRPDSNMNMHYARLRKLPRVIEITVTQEHGKAYSYRNRQVISFALLSGETESVYLWKIFTTKI